MPIELTDYSCLRALLKKFNISAYLAVTDLFMLNFYLREYVD